VSYVQVDAADLLGRTALHHAAYLGSINCTYVLLDFGASVTARNKDGHIPMTLAIQNRCTDVMEALSKAMAKVGAQEEED
jgi:ankyrin repeat protein